MQPYTGTHIILLHPKPYFQLNLFNLSDALYNPEWAVIGPRLVLYRISNTCVQDAAEELTWIEEKKRKLQSNNKVVDDSNLTEKIKLLQKHQALQVGTKFSFCRCELLL
jgi:hypothetical protein